MKHILITTIAAVVLVGCGESQEQDIWSATAVGDTNTIELLIAVGQNVNAKNKDGETPLDIAVYKGLTKTTNILRKHGGKTGAELKAEGK